nr:hypothetical protein [Gordonia araii]
MAIGRRSERLGVRRAAIAFVTVWAIAMVVNMGIGISHGYTLAEELPILLINILPAALVAGVGAYLLEQRSGTGR